MHAKEKRTQIKKKKRRKAVDRKKDREGKRVLLEMSER